MSIIDSIQLSGVTYQIQGSGGGGNPTVELTQAEYDALVTAGTVSADTYYIITDAQAGDLTNYYTKTETDNAITAATSTKQDTLVSGTNIKTINNESILGSGNIDIQGGGGGKAIEAGRGISITTGETADTVSFDLPISAGTGTNSIAEGDNTTASGIYGSHAEGYRTRATGWGAHAEGNNTNANGNYSHAEGNQTVANGNQSHAEGVGTIANNVAEHASGQYNVSNKANSTWGDSGNTLFSVGNGTSTNARHNAFEIRQNGDIYLSSGGTDIKLQDHLGGGGGGGMTEDDELLLATALTDLNDRKIDASEVKSNYQKKGDYVTTNTLNTRLAEYETALDEQNVEEVTAYALNDLNDRFGGLKITKITESEYAALTTKDENTLYIVVADPS